MRDIIYNLEILMIKSNDNTHNIINPKVNTLARYGT